MCSCSSRWEDATCFPGVREWARHQSSVQDEGVLWMPQGGRSQNSVPLDFHLLSSSLIGPYVNLSKYLKHFKNAFNHNHFVLLNLLVRQCVLKYLATIRRCTMLLVYVHIGDWCLFNKTYFWVCDLPLINVTLYSFRLLWYTTYSDALALSERSLSKLFPSKWYRWVYGMGI